MLKFGSKNDVTVVYRATIRLLDDARDHTLRLSESKRETGSLVGETERERASSQAVAVAAAASIFWRARRALFFLYNIAAAAAAASCAFANAALYCCCCREEKLESRRNKRAKPEPQRIVVSARYKPRRCRFLGVQQRRFHTQRCFSRAPRRSHDIWYTRENVLGQRRKSYRHRRDIIRTVHSRAREARSNVSFFTQSDLCYSRGPGREHVAWVLVTLGKSAALLRKVQEVCSAQELTSESPQRPGAPPYIARRGRRATAAAAAVVGSPLLESRPRSGADPSEAEKRRRSAELGVTYSACLIIRDFGCGGRRRRIRALSRIGVRVSICRRYRAWCRIRVRAYICQRYWAWCRIRVRPCYHARWGFFFLPLVYFTSGVVAG
ncbi:unnamed protein product [Trichogramma brassicae]|uniref:Uncharacterized protein n=1 Tax=Trichogramma brassicae TaxID=86971 RepID=A0A6H5ICP7_9HYME|nr:unnamed protein product [Trichogramma brassicae]